MSKSGNGLGPPRISVVMPSFNQVRFIEESISSVLAQRYPKLEFIILDGGSTDGSVEIIKKYENKLVYWHSRSDNGQTYALMDGFKLARGELMGWINSDDILLPNALEIISSAYQTNPGVELLFGNFFLIDDIGSITRCQRVPQSRIEWFAKRGHWVFNGTGAFFSRRAYDEIGGLNSDLSYVMDADLYIRMINKGIKYKHVGEYISAFRRHNEAKTVYDAQKSKSEHLYAAVKYWPPNAAKGRKQRRWRYLYWAFQILNGNLKMYFDEIRIRGKHWRLYRGADGV